MALHALDWLSDAAAARGLPGAEAFRRQLSSRLLIDGAWRDGVGERFPVLHPATNETVGSIACATEDEVDAAVEAARRAFDAGPWPRLRAAARRDHLLRIADAIEKHSTELTLLQTLENGVPLSFSEGTRLSGQFPAEIFRYHAGWVDKLGGETYPAYTDGVDLQFISIREPVGVVAAICPWNGPLMQIANKIAPALAAGCTVVVKPSEYASLAVMRLLEIIQDTDLPPGVLNGVTGLGRPTGDHLVSHRGVDKVSFTGSKGVGTRIIEASASTLKRVTLELGGKSAGLVFADADLERAARAIMGVLAFGLSGQVCTSQTRALVHRSVLAPFIDAVRQVARGARFGNPFDLRTTSAALINKPQLARVLGYIEDAKTDGAELVSGGARLTVDGLDAGNFVAPTIFSKVRNAMRIAQEEVFGPVLCVMSFETEEEAIRVANESVFGLSGGVYTRDMGRALRVAKGVRAGTIGVNGYTFLPNAPNGGIKASGMGREGGRASIEAYTELKTIMLSEVSGSPMDA